MSVRPRRPLPGAVLPPETSSRTPRPSSRRSFASPLELRFLGGFEAVVAGRPVHGLAPRKVQALLAYLTLAGGRPVSRDLLAGLLWSAAPEAAAHQSLRQAIYSLRRQLGPVGGSAGRSAIGSDPQDVWLDPAIVAASDVARFTAAAARAGDPDADPVALQGAIAALYRGELLEGLFVAGCERFTEWLEEERSRLRALAIAALLALLHRHELDARLETGMAAARQLLVIDPLSEEAHRHLIRLLARAGRRDEAIAEFEAWRGQLARDLGAEPMRATVALYRTLLSGAYLPDVPMPLDGVIEPLIPFVGRERELAALAREWERLVRSGGSSTTVVAGGAGVGKSRLVRTFLDRMFESGRGPRVAIVAAEALSGEAAPNPRLEFLAGLGRGSAREPLPVAALVLLHENAGVEPVSVAARVRRLETPPGLPIWVLATRRAAAPSPTAAVAAAGLALPGGEVAEIRLDRLDAAALWELATALVGPAGAGSLAEALEATTGGLPWAVAEAINLLTDEGALETSAQTVERNGKEELGPGGERWRLAGPLSDFPLPATPLELVERRLALLPRGTRRLLTLAAVAGPRFDAALLAAAEGETRPAVEAALATLVERRFVRPWILGWLPGPRGRDRALAAAVASCGRFEFVCPTLREAVCGLLPEARRRAVELEIEAARGSAGSP